MRAAWLAMPVAVAALASGCGGSGSGTTSTAHASAGATAATGASAGATGATTSPTPAAPPAGGTGATGPTRSPKKPRARKRASAPTHHASTTPAHQPKPAKPKPTAPANRAHATAARKTTLIVLGLYGMRAQTVSATRSGDGVHAAVGIADACPVDPTVEAQVVARIRKAVTFVHSVSITVAGTGQTLSAYARSSCAAPRLPGGPGRIVLTQTGSGSVTTNTFTIHSARWSIDYVNAGRLLAVLPLKGGVPTIGAFSVTKHGAGQHLVQGAGTYDLQVTGVGTWIVRVRDGA